MYAIDVVMNLQSVKFIFLIGKRLRVLNSELNSTITAIRAYVIDCTRLIQKVRTVSL